MVQPDASPAQIAPFKQSQARSGSLHHFFINMGSKIDALGLIANQIIRSNPLDPATWTVDFFTMLAHCKGAFTNLECRCETGVRLIEQSSGLFGEQRQIRADRRSRGKSTWSVWQSNKDAMSLTPFVMDSKLETMAIRKIRTEPHSLNKSNNAFANKWREIFLSHTSEPYYHGEQSAYTFIPAND